MAELLAEKPADARLPIRAKPDQRFHQLMARLK